SEDDAEGAIGAVRQVHSTSQMIKREIPILVIMSEIDPQASISTHIKGQIKREGIPVLSTDMNGLTGFKEMQTFGGKPTGAALRMANQVLGNLQVDGYIDCYNQVKMKVAK
ncbi:MAG: hypothetical protein GY847_11325, partial [Proteobacteria bacterium]|nr:hypothetical protein [Pseudomonadota bacterium]